MAAGPGIALRQPMKVWSFRAFRKDLSRLLAYNRLVGSIITQEIVPNWGI